MQNNHCKMTTTEKNCTDINCSTCIHFIKGRLCRKLSVRINERDLEGTLKCRYYANTQENGKKAVDTRA